jgi:tRNA G18 (ribose-2'-O)-methylase SpoU
MPRIVVEDPGDPRLSGYVALTDADHARDDDTFVAEGLLVLDAVLATSTPLRSVLCIPSRVDEVERRAGDVAIYVGGQDVVDAITGFHLHRGVVGIAQRPPALAPADLLETATSLLVLESVNDLENLGALFRNAAAFGAGGVLLCPRTADPLYRRTVRVSLGHVLRVPFARATSWPSAIDDVRAAGFTTIALTPSGDQRVDDLASPAKPAVLVGAEGPGLSDEALAAADLRVRIPMAPGVDSVNVATAAAIALHRLVAR